MKLRSLTLSNVRRFAGRTVTTGPIGDGLSVLAAPNESGKSTFFDSLHALMFLRHTGSAKEVKLLRPHSGGGVTIAADIDSTAGAVRIEKTFLTAKAARVLDRDSGQLIAAQDDAEAWIEKHLTTRFSGPAGLLWVRQGATTFDRQEAESKTREREDQLNTRRDLMSALAGEIDIMTGGQRMDAMFARCDAALAPLITDTGRPRANGPLAQAMARTEALAQTLATQQDKVAALRDRLDRRRQAEATRADLQDPDAVASRKTRLTEARIAVQAAHAHVDRCANAQRELDLAESETRNRAAALTRHDSETADLTRTRTATETTAAATAETEPERDAARVSAQQARKARTDADTAVTGLRHRLETARRAQAALAAQVRLADLQTRLTRAEAQRDAADTAQAQAAACPVTADLLTDLDSAAAALQAATARRDAQAVTLTMHYEGAARITRDGSPLPHGTPLVLPGATTLDLPGLGTLSIDPGARGKSAELAQAVTDAQARLAQLLALGAADNLATARTAFDAAQDHRRAARSAQDMLRTLAPDGLDALRRDVAAATRTADGAPDTPPEDLAMLEDALRESEAALRTARTCEEQAIHRLQIAETTHARTAAAAEAAAQALIALTDRLHDEIPRPQARAALLEALTRAEASRTRCAADLDTLTRDAPDLEAAKAVHARWDGVMTSTEQQDRELEVEIARLTEAIRADAEEGIEEACEATREALVAARARAAALEHEVAVVTLLRDTLNSQRAAAQDAYFEPVRQEIEPLLSMLFGGGALAMDSDSLLPATLDRNGTAELLDSLSGGTAEQVAILTRLAFARLLKKQGYDLPVILDDALVHTDDYRIETMFTALHRIAADQQIIVLTCRQKAFQDLGGARLEIRDA